VSLSDCEFALLFHLHRITQIPMAEHVRQAIFAYALSDHLKTGQL
jgi:hypothetical protein